MNPFPYQLGELFCEAAPADEIVRRYGSPVVVYSAAGIRANIAAVREAFAGIDPEIRFPVQSLPSPGVLRAITAEGCGMVAMSAGELERAWLSRAPMTMTSFAGVGKTDDDIRAALDGIYSPLFQAGVTVDGRPPTTEARSASSWRRAQARSNASAPLPSRSASTPASRSA